MVALEPGKDPTYLVLGWRVNRSLDPEYWLKRSAKSGAQSEGDLVKVPAPATGNHTAIIAQSGSGKSFFLGRLVEELLLQTKSRCVILDPNADFRRVHEVEGPALWDAAAYDAHRRRGRLPHEASRAAFETLWSRVPIRISTGAEDHSGPYESLQLSWPSLSIDFLAEDLAPMLRSELYHCHAFVQIIAALAARKKEKGKGLINEAERLLRMARQLSEADFRSVIERDFDVSPYRSWLRLLTAFGLSVRKPVERALTAAAYVSDDVTKFYFGRAREYEAAGILAKDDKALESALTPAPRLEVVDLPSLPDKSTRLLAVNALLTTEWERARRSWAEALARPRDDDDRVPTFIVVDEAHNLIPLKPANRAEEALTEQFRTIVAEGRKYGLFVILVSQRPDKLDRLVLSECENKAIMRLGSGSVLKVTQEMLGLEDVPPKVLEKCLEFEMGRGLLIGPWAPDGQQQFYCAARRTVEGGRNLRSDHWAAPPSSAKAADDRAAAASDKLPEKPSVS